jgi:predicted nucleic acid-binding protein
VSERRSLLDTSVIIDPPEQGTAAFAAEVAEFYGLLANVVRQTGRNPRPRRIDLLIAATAVRHGFSLATRNGGDLRQLERVLTVINVQ